MRKVVPILALLILAAGLSRAQDGLRDRIVDRCPTLSRLINTGQIDQVRDPVFTDPNSARQFADVCARVARELGAEVVLPPDLAQIKSQAEMAAEFLTGDTYDLSTSTVPSVVKLRDWVKIPPPKGLVYVKKYKPTDGYPDGVAAAFNSLSNREDRARVEGVTIQGRYIVLLTTDYHDELEDNLSHEMVHAYITLASPKTLPTWFQEGAAVYFSLGQEGKLYGRTGDPKMKQIVLPEDYMTRLHSFQFLEQQLGKQKLYDFIRESVETGKPDPRSKLGLDKPKQPFKPPVLQIAAVIAGVAILFFLAYYRSAMKERMD